MKKEDLKNSIDLIEPDPYMGTRLKAKMTVQKTSTVSFKKIGAYCVAVALIFALLFGFNPSPATTPSTKDNSTTENSARRGIPFIMVASAVEDTAPKPLKLNEAFPFACKISFIDTRGMNKAEKEKAFLDSKNMANNFHSDLHETNRFTIRSGFDNIILIEQYLNYIKLNLSASKSIKSINAKTSTKWGQIEYISNIPKENPLPQRGNDVTITAEEWDEESSGFYWRNTAEMSQAIDANPDVPLSSYSDTITITVEYANGGKTINIIDITFDDDGNGTFTMRDYRYSE